MYEALSTATECSYIKTTHRPDLCKVWAANGWSWNAVENPQWKAFTTKWIPGSQNPSATKLSGPVLDHEEKEIETDVKHAVEGKIGTGQCDGWKSVAKKHIIASMVSVANEPYLIHVHDVSDKPKTADTLLNLVIQDIFYCWTVLNLLIIAWCTDAGSDAASMRRKLKEQIPWIIVIDCWAHQLNLIVGDYFKLSIPGISDCVDMAVELIKWFNNHSYALGLLATQQRAMGAMTSLALLLPVLTRWTSHFLALSRLLHLKRSIRACVDTHYEVLVKSAGKRDMQARARQILGYVYMESFWEGIERVRNDLQPLAIAANILQASSTRLDHVLLTLGNLYRTFSQPCYSDEVREGVHRSLEKRWRKNADQDVFILAVLLNPYIRHHAFRAGNPLLRPASLFALARRVYNRIFENDVDTGFHTAFWDYLKGSKEFSSANMGLDFWKRAHEEALDNKFAIDVAQIWASVDTGVSTGRNSLVKLAVRILSIIANSADTERVFSNMGFEHTKVRNRLSVQRLRKRIAIKMGLKRLHQSLGLAKGRRRRQVSDLASNLTSTASSSSSLPSTSIPPLADFARHGSTNTLATASQSLALDNLQVPPDIRKMLQRECSDIVNALR